MLHILTLQPDADERRRFLRVPVVRDAFLVVGHDDTARGQCIDAGRGGLRVVTGRYLRPGRRALVTLAEGDRRMEMPAQVAWCRPGLADHGFELGLRVWHDEPDTLESLNGLVHAGLFESGIALCLQQGALPHAVRTARETETPEVSLAG
jgi:hypothetical protein